MNRDLQGILGWEQVHLGDVADVVGGGTPKSDVAVFWDGDIAWATPTDVTALSGFNIQTTKRTITQLGLQSSSATLLPPNSVLVTSRATIGYVAINTVPMATNQGFVNLIPKLNENRADSLFLAYMLESRRGELQRLAAGSTFPEVSKSSVQRMQFQYPPLQERYKIAQLLSSIDEALEASKAVLEQLLSAREILLQTLLINGISGSHEIYQLTEFGHAPAAWQVVTLQDVCIDKGLQTGPFGSQLKASEYTENGIPVIMPVNLIGRHVSTNAIVRIPFEKAKNLARHQVLKGDVLFARRGDIGRFGYIGEAEEGWICGTGCLRARPSQKIDPAYLAIYLTRPFVSRWLTKNAVGQTMLNLNTKILGELPILLPNLDEQHKIASAIESFDKRIVLERTKTKQLDHVKHGLMKQLLSGKLRVAVDDG